MADVIAYKRSQSAHERSWSEIHRSGSDAFGLDELATFWLATEGLKELLRQGAANETEDDDLADANYSVMAATQVIREIDTLGAFLLAKERELPLNSDADWDIAFGAWTQWRIDHVVPLGLLHATYQEGEDS